MSKAAAAIENAKKAGVGGGLVERKRESISPKAKSLTTMMTDDAAMPASNVVEMRHGQESIYVLPETVEPVEIGDRMEREGEEEKLEQLARSIEVNGQEVPCVVTEEIAEGTGEITYRLHFGRRRRLAVMRLNAELPKEAEPYQLWCVIDRTGGDMYRKALAENIQREDYTPIEKAQIIERVIRAKWRAEGKAGDKEAMQAGRKGGLQQTQIEYAAGYLKVDPKTVRDLVRLLKLDGETQQAVHNGLMTYSAAIALLGEVKEEKRDEVARHAKATVKSKTQEKSKVPTTTGTAPGTPSQSSKTLVHKPTLVTAPDIRKSARELGAAKETKQLTRGEILDFIKTQNCPANGYDDGAINSWAVYFVDVYAKGEGTERTCQAKFDRMVEAAALKDRGTKPGVIVKMPEKSAPKPETKSAPKAKPVAKPSPKAKGKK